MAQIDNLLRDIRALQRRIQILETVFQGKYLQYGPILLDSVLGRVSIFDTSALANELIRIDQNGIRLVTINNSYSQLFTFYRNTTQVGAIDHLRATGAVVTTEMRTRIIQPTDSERVTYITNQIESALGSRDVTFQMSILYVGNVFSEIGLNFITFANSPSFAVVVDDISGHGWLRIPEKSTPPAGAGALVYFDTGATKFRGRTPGGAVVDFH